MMRARLISAAVFGAGALLPFAALYALAVAQGVDLNAPDPMAMVVPMLALATVGGAVAAGAAGGPRLAALPGPGAAALWGVGLTAVAAVAAVFIGFAIVVMIDPNDNPPIKGLLSPDLWGLTGGAALILSPLVAAAAVVSRYLTRRGAALPGAPVPEVRP